MAMLALLVLPVLAKIKIEAMEHDVQEITGRNFDSVISKFRDAAVASVFMFKPGDDIKLFDAYNEVAKELKGMAKITAINCEDWPVFRKDHEGTETPKIKLFPVNPMPAYLYKGKLEKGAISKAVSKMIQNLATDLTKDNVDAWLTSDATKPKVILFSNKDKVPTILKALSSETVFRRSVKFGFCKQAEDTIVKRFGIKKFPTFLMLRGGKLEQKEQYKGEMNFREIYTWVNLYSESGMGDKVHTKGSAEEQEVTLEEAKPWLVQEVPELTAASQADICFKGEGLCVIYLRNGALSDDDTSLLKGMKSKFTSQLEGRGTTFKWMWIDLSVETGFKELFGVEEFPGAVVFNPHKRLRFTKLEGQATATGIQSLIDKILGGDARFTMVKGQKLPAWANRAKAGGKKAEL